MIASDITPEEAAHRNRICKTIRCDRCGGKGCIISIEPDEKPSMPARPGPAPDRDARIVPPALGAGQTPI